MDRCVPVKRCSHGRHETARDRRVEMVLRTCEYFIVGFQDNEKRDRATRCF